MSVVRSYCLMLGLILSVSCEATPTIAKDFQAVVSYVEVVEGIYPRNRTKSRNTVLTVNIAESGELSQTENVKSPPLGRTRRSGGHIYETGVDDNQILKLGPSNGGIKWRVAGQNQLVNIADFESYRRAILLTVKASDCSAEVNYQLKSGFSDFRYTQRGQSAVAKSITAQSTTCIIQ